MDKDILQGLLRRPVAFYPIFAQVAGGAKAGLFLSQLFYWSDKGANPEGWIHKPGWEWEKETCLSRSEQESARRSLIARQVMQEKLAGQPARLHYRIIWANLLQALQTSLQETRKLDSGKPANKDAENQQTSLQETSKLSLSESTTESTTESTQESPAGIHPAVAGSIAEYNRVTGQLFSPGNLIGLIERIKKETGLTDDQVAGGIRRYTRAKFSSGVRKNLGTMLRSKWEAWMTADGVTTEELERLNAPRLLREKEA